MININKVILLGRLTKEVDLRYTSGNNTAVATFSIAVNRRMAKEGQTQADFFNCQAWGKTAEFINSHFVKGQQMAIVGRLQNREWTDKDNKKHYVTEVIVDEPYFAGSKQTNSQPENNQQSYTPSVQSGDGFYPMDELDSDLPF